MLFFPAEIVNFRDDFVNMIKFQKSGIDFP